ncbi:MAG: dicarboxylate/amino acid:cation symporter [Chlamydiia bacterium]|nr:dicarboxylate/amino acid:cation symporter [Chlamydiia bacterium]
MKSNVIFNFGMLLALTFGGLFGYLNLPVTNNAAHVISHLFLNLLKLISLPMIFLAIVSTLTKMTSLKEAGLMLRKILKYTLLTTIIAATIGMILFIFIDPVKPVAGGADEAALVSTQADYLSFLLKIIPDNLVQPFIENNVLGMAFIATLFSIAILKLPEKQSHLLRDVFGALFAALLKITSMLILLMPIGIFAFTVQFFQSINKEKHQLEELLFYGACVVAANLIQGLVILPLMLKLKGHSPLKTFRAMSPALTMAFFSKSSSATLPLALDCAKNRLGVSDKTASFSLPLCSIINMNGCAAFILITLFFVCSSYGMTFTVWEMIPWIFLATFAAIGNAGIPMGCFFLTTAFLLGMGVPIEMMKMIVPLYSLFDMVETALNVWSDSCITTVVDKELATGSLSPPIKIDQETITLV